MPIYSTFDTLGRPSYVVGNWYFPDGYNVIAGSAIASTTMRVTPFWLRQPITISHLASRVTTTHAAETFRLGIYSAISAVNPLPGTLIDSVGSLSAASGTVVEGALAANRALTAGLYWMAFQQEGSTLAVQAFITGGGMANWLAGNSTSTNVSTSASAVMGGYAITNTYGDGFPASLSGASLTAVNGSGIAAVMFKVASVP